MVALDAADEPFPGSTNECNEDHLLRGWIVIFGVRIFDIVDAGVSRNELAVVTPDIFSPAGCLSVSERNSWADRMQQECLLGIRREP